MTLTLINQTLRLPLKVDQLYLGVLMNLVTRTNRLIGLLLAASLTLAFTWVSGASSANAALPDSATVTIHYQRPASDYAGWNAYLWKNVDGNADKEVIPAGFAFTGSDSFGAIATTTVTGMALFKDIGFIIRSKPDWSGSKDIGADRFLPISNSGVGEIWLLQGDSKVYTVAPLVDPAIKSAVLDEFRSLTVSLNKTITVTGSGNEGFSVSGGFNVVSVEPVNLSGSKASVFKVNVDANFAIGGSYIVTLDAHGTNPAFGSVQSSVGNLMNSDGFNELFTYTGDDLGNTYTAEQTDFRVWAPTASKVELVVFSSDVSPSADASVTEMTQSVKGTWVASLVGDQNGTIYMYRVTVNGSSNLAVDPYVRSTTVNGERGVVVDLASTDPAGWASETKPVFSGKPTDAVVYELHVRDLSMDSSSGIPASHVGKFLGLTDNATSTKFTVKVTDPKTKRKVNKTYSTLTGVAAIKNLGVSHVQLLPIFDFASGGDERNANFNWGYDPLNYNVPEGAYSSDATNPNARINELKQAVQSLHSQGLRVTMDVVYNHVSNAASFSQELIVPGYFFRKDESGNLTSASGCGNDFASERPMARKFIVDSTKYWTSQYHLDGFRFDLMGLIDVTTMNQVRAAVSEIDPTNIIIGEGWNMGTLPEDQRGDQVNIASMPGIGAFNDQIRDGIKGSVFNSSEQGYISGKVDRRSAVKGGVLGQIDNPGYSSDASFAWNTADPGQSVNYVEAHDNLTLRDKLEASTGKKGEPIALLARQAGALVVLSQGMPFMQAGQEFLRSKNGDSNSYSSGDNVNSLKWKQRALNATTVAYYRGLIQLRKTHPAFRLSTSAAIKNNLRFMGSSSGLLAYQLNGAASGDTWSKIVVVTNPGSKTVSQTLPVKANWSLVVSGSKAGTATLSVLKKSNKVSVPAHSTVVLYSGLAPRT